MGSNSAFALDALRVSGRRYEGRAALRQLPGWTDQRRDVEGTDQLPVRVEPKFAIELCGAGPLPGPRHHAPRGKGTIPVSRLYRTEVCSSDHELVEAGCFGWRLGGSETTYGRFGQFFRQHRNLVESI